jgi:hypothetical protein
VVSVPRAGECSCCTTEVGAPPAAFAVLMPEEIGKQRSRSRRTRLRRQVPQGGSQDRRRRRRAVGSKTPWWTAMPLPVGLQNSHQNGGWVFLIFVADPRTGRLCSTSAPFLLPMAPTGPAAQPSFRQLIRRHRRGGRTSDGSRQADAGTSRRFRGDLLRCGRMARRGTRPRLAVVQPAAVSPRLRPIRQPASGQTHAWREESARRT